MDTLVKDKTLRLSVLKVNSETLDKFDVKVVAERQKQVAPFTTSLVRAAAGLDNVDDSAFDSDDEPAVELSKQQLQKKHSLRSQDWSLIATVSLCMMCYARNQQSNLLQVVISYLTYTDNVPKQKAKIFHRMELLITPKTVQKVLSANAAAIRAEL